MSMLNPVLEYFWGATGKPHLSRSIILPLDGDVRMTEQLRRGGMNFVELQEAMGLFLIYHEGLFVTHRKSAGCFTKFLLFRTTN